MFNEHVEDLHRSVMCLPLIVAKQRSVNKYDWVVIMTDCINRNDSNPTVTENTNILDSAQSSSDDFTDQLQKLTVFVVSKEWENDVYVLVFVNNK